MLEGFQRPAQALMRGAIGACFAMDCVIWAVVEGVPIDELEVEVTTELDGRGMLGLADVPRGFRFVSVTAWVRSPAPRTNLERVLARARRLNPRLNEMVARVGPGGIMTLVAAERIEALALADFHGAAPAAARDAMGLTRHDLDGVLVSLAASRGKASVWAAMPGGCRRPCRAALTGTFS